MRLTIQCACCGEPIDAHHTVFEHALCCPPLAPVSAWQLEKNFTKLQRKAQRVGLTLVRVGPQAREEATDGD